MNRYLLGLTLALLLLLGPPRPLQTAAAESPGRFCYAWGLLNNTGVDADGLQARFKGVQTISSVYAGSFNPFGEPLPSSGYNPKSDSYFLQFEGGLAFAGDPVTLGFCTASATARAGSDAWPVSWWEAGSPSAPAPRLVGIRWVWDGGAGALIDLYNDQSDPLTIMMANLLDPGEALALDDLTGDVVRGLPVLAELISEPLPLAGNGLVSLSYPPPVSVTRSESSALLGSNQPLVLEVVALADDDPGNLTTLYIQAVAPARVYLPTLLH
jgi:hypothetical protein